MFITHVLFSYHFISAQGPGACHWLRQDQNASLLILQVSVLASVAGCYLNSGKRKKGKLIKGFQKMYHILTLPIRGHNLVAKGHSQ